MVVLGAGYTQTTDGLSSSAEVGFIRTDVCTIVPWSMRQCIQTIQYLLLIFFCYAFILFLANKSTWVIRGGSIFNGPKFLNQNFQTWFLISWEYFEWNFGLLRFLVFSDLKRSFIGHAKILVNILSGIWKLSL